jgi:hypothetical protein
VGKDLVDEEGNTPLELPEYIQGYINICNILGQYREKVENEQANRSTGIAKEDA